MTTSVERRRLGGKLRALLSLGMLLGIAQVGTLAAWTDSATVETGSFETGNLDLTIGANSAGQLEGQGGTWDYAQFSLSGMAPGESVARMLTVGNGGSIALSYNGTATVSSALAGPNGMHLTVVEDATDASNSGSQSASNREGTCSGGSSTSVTNDALSTDPISINKDPVALAPEATRSYCVIAKLSKDAPNDMQDSSATITLDFQAEQ